MNIMVLSSITGGCVGILRILDREAAIYDPITGRKKYVIAGVDASDEFVLPKKTTVERLAMTPEDGSMLYDTDTKKIYIGDGSTAGGVMLDDGLYTRMGTAESDIAELKDDVAALENGETALDGRVTALETAVAPDVTLLTQQFAFFHAEGTRDLGHINCGEFAQDGFFPLDWDLGNWSHNGLILTFNNWA